MTRQQRTADADALCTRALATTLDGRDETGLALVAVGGYGRAELAPYSDLDVVLVHDAAVDVDDVAARVWYPLWNEGVDLDHSVRALPEVTEAARSDPRVALGLLDARHLAGDPAVTLRMRTALLAQWRREARSQLPALEGLVKARSRRQGELAHAAVPDLKESVGGLRDATILKAMVATWLVDVPHGELERCRQLLLDVRDELHEITGRATDRVAPELWGELAERLGRADAESAQRHVRGIGRLITHLSRLTWRRVDAVLAGPTTSGRRAPDLRRVAPGVAVASREVVLDRGTTPASDPLLLLRAAAEAAERDLVLAPPTAGRLAREGAELPEPWSAEARNLFVRMLAAGPGLLQVWETLDETGALDRLMPEWERVRLLPHASVVHRFTVDRHMVETCIEASRLIRRVRRPDLLMAAAILHDIGKSESYDHSVAGEPLAVAAARRMGFEPVDVQRVGALVRWHLLLAEVATTRDLDDPATIDHVASRVQHPETLDLLEVLTEADARATSTKAWTTWRAGLVAELAERVRVALESPGDATSAVQPEPVEIPVAVREDPERIDVHLTQTEGGSRILVVSGDRVGLMATAAGVLALQRISVRAVRAWTQDDYAISLWDVDDGQLDEAILRERLAAFASGRRATADRLRTLRSGDLDPSVQVRHDASDQATVLEVRVDDRQGVLYLACRALADLDLSVRSAHATTLGPQAVDVFYVQERGAAALTDERAAASVYAVRRALTDAVTLDV